VGFSLPIKGVQQLQALRSSLAADRPVLTAGPTAAGVVARSGTAGRKDLQSVAYVEWRVQGELLGLSPSLAGLTGGGAEG